MLEAMVISDRPVATPARNDAMACPVLGCQSLSFLREGCDMLAEV